MEKERESREKEVGSYGREERLYSLIMSASLIKFLNFVFFLHFSIGKKKFSNRLKSFFNPIKEHSFFSRRTFRLPLNLLVPEVPKDSRYVRD